MRTLAIVGLALCAGLTACGPPADPSTYQKGGSDIKAIQVGDRAFRCLVFNDIGMSTQAYELKGDLRAKFLTPSAVSSSVRVWVASSSVTDYGSTRVTYTDQGNSCVLWSESLTMQEFSQKLGLNPVGLSPYYETDKPLPVATPTPVPSSTPSPEPTATPSPSSK